MKVRGHNYVPAVVGSEKTITKREKTINKMCHSNKKNPFLQYQKKMISSQL